MEKVIVKFSIDGNEFIWNVDRDLHRLYKMGSTCVRSGKRNKIKVRFRVYEADSSLCLLAMYSRVNKISDKWIARLSSLCYYGGSSGLEL